MYETNSTKETPDGNKRKVDAVGNIDGQLHPVHLCFGYGRSVYPWIVGKGSRQWRDIQNDFTRLQHLNRRHDWLPIWYQTHAE